MALGWLWSRTDSADAGEPVDLETIDAWRQGLLKPKRRKEVEHQLANDPLLMQQLEELEAADELLRELEIADLEQETRSDLVSSVQRAVERFFDTVRNPVFAGGLTVTASAIFLLVVFSPFRSSPTLGLHLNDVYASLEMPTESVQVPWTPKLVTRGGTAELTDAAAAKLQKMLELAFQSGMADGIQRLESRFLNPQLNPGGYVRAAVPACDESILQCEQLTELAGLTGKWSVAVFLECQRLSEGADQPALSLLPSLQKAWRHLPFENTLGLQVRAVSMDAGACIAAEKLLHDWGRPALPMGGN